MNKINDKRQVKIEELVELFQRGLVMCAVKRVTGKVMFEVDFGQGGINNHSISVKTKMGEIFK